MLEASDAGGARLAHHRNALGRCALQQGNLTAANDQLRQALLIGEVLAPESLATGRIVANLAQAHEAGKDDASAQL